MLPTDEQNEQEGPKPGRPRSKRAQQDILTAALEVLAETGYEAMRIEHVAMRAGVGKTTIYRWWSSKEDLTSDAIKTLHADVPIIDTGNLRDDVIALLQATIRVWNTYQRLICRLIGEMYARPELFQRLRSRLLEPRIQSLAQRLKNAQVRGELRRDIDPLEMLEAFIGPLWCRLLFRGSDTTISCEDVERLVDMTFQGLVYR